ncbi:MAG TPA: TIR domain-containing protein, partial [Caulobacteraceae bacterium]|nr:TIR domain-containing protein [Caulobacteraceae bacterium]
MSDIFISYARSTAAKAQQVAEALRALGYGVWRDDELPAHRAFAEVIEERLKAAKAVVVVWSAEAAASEWVQSEADRARAERKLVQLRVDDAPLPMPFDRIQCADLTNWSGEPDAPGWKKVAASIADLIAPAAAPAAPAGPRHRNPKQASICVLPFANMSGDPEQEYFSDGISEDIITDLSKVSALSVVSRNTAFSFKGRSIDVRGVAGQLGVGHVLEGSVRKAGNRVRITAQLIEAADDSHVWAERYDRDLTDIFELQDEISRAIVAALKLKLLPQEKQAIGRRGTDSVEAYNLFLMARQQHLAGNYGDPRREEAMIRMCQRAVEIDPAYAQAWSLLAYAQSSLRYNRGRDGEDGRAAADKAMQLDPTLAEPHAVKAKNLAETGRLPEALVEVETALALGPDSVEVFVTAGLLSMYDHRMADAERYYAKAVEMDETSVGPAGLLVTIREMLGDADGARRAAEICLARAEKLLAQDRNNGNALAFAVGAMAVLGQAERAREWMNRALLVDPDNLLMRYNFACALVRFGEAQEAIDMLAPVLTTSPASMITHARVDGDLDPLRADPRFIALLAQAD